MHLQSCHCWSMLPIIHMLWAVIAPARLAGKCCRAPNWRLFAVWQMNVLSYLSSHSQTEIMRKKDFCFFFYPLSFLVSFLVFNPTSVISFPPRSVPSVRFDEFTYRILFFPVQWFGHINDPILINGKWEPRQLFFFKNVINYIWLIWVHLKPQK